MRRILGVLLTVCLMLSATACKKDETASPTTGPATPAGGKAPLKIGYSDWPGWVAWEIAIQKGWFKEEGVDVEFKWLDYVKSMEAYGAGQLDANCMTNGDAMVTGDTGKPSVCIVLNDFSNGNDMVIAAPGIDSVKALKGKKVGVEVGFVDHLLLLKALEANGMTEKDIEIVKVKTDETPKVLASKAVDAIAAWQPNCDQALKNVKGSKPVFTSKDVPGLIYDGLYVNRDSLSTRFDDWQKVVKIWFKVVAYIKDEKTQEDAFKIMAGRVGLPPAEYKAFIGGTAFLDLEGNLKAYKVGEGLDSVYGSSEIVNKFNVANEVYKKPADVKSYLEPRLVEKLKK